MILASGSLHQERIGPARRQNQHRFWNSKLAGVPVRHFSAVQTMNKVRLRVLWIFWILMLLIVGAAIASGPHWWKDGYGPDHVFATRVVSVKRVQSCRRRHPGCER